MRTKIFHCAILIMVLINPVFAGSRVITKKDFGEKWPFTVDKGTLECVQGRFIIFHANGKIYAVNGAAGGVSKRMGYADIKEVWSDDPSFDRFYKTGDPDHPKISIGPIIDAGLRLCK